MMEAMTAHDDRSSHPHRPRPPHRDPPASFPGSKTPDGDRQPHGLLEIADRFPHRSPRRSLQTPTRLLELACPEPRLPAIAVVGSHG